jgi:hypothetical protein
MNKTDQFRELLEQRQPNNGNGRPKGEAAPSQAAEDTGVANYIYLKGRPELKEFLRYVKKNSVDPEPEDELISEWKTAQKHIAKLERQEAGAADNPTFTKLDVNGRHQPFLIELLKDPIIQNGFNTVPTDIAIIELDKLVVYQKHIDVSHVEELKKKIGPAPTEDELFKFCLPYDHPHPPVKWGRKGRDGYVFVSPSNDLRYLGTLQLKPENIVNYPHSGSLVGVIGFAAGFGSNFLNAVYTHNRLILNNGSHRSYALRALGITHAPCIVQHVHSMDELDVVATSEIADNPDYFLKHPRPAMLPDYFNPRLRKEMKVNRKLREITVKFSFEESDIPAL